MYVKATMSVPTTSAIGRLRRASLSSALMLVAMIQPSYAKAVAATAVNSAWPLPPSTVVTTVVKFSIVVPLAKPTIVPTMPMSSSGMSLMTVVAT